MPSQSINKKVINFAASTLAVISIFSTFPSLAQGQTHYKLNTMFTGNDKCLDIINDSKDNKPIMAKCGNFSGQFWKIPNF